MYLSGLWFFLSFMVLSVVLMFLNSLREAYNKTNIGRVVSSLALSLLLFGMTIRILQIMKKEGVTLYDWAPVEHYASGELNSSAIWYILVLTTVPLSLFLIRLAQSKFFVDRNN